MSISVRQTMTGSVETRQSVNGEVSTPINTSVIFQPSVSEEGILSWTNDKGLPNPDPIDISGPPGYTPVKGVDYFDGEPGEPGYTPVKGVDYFDGEPGYTPVKGVDYFDGEPGYTPVKGKDYFDGDKGDPFTYADFTEEQLKSLKGEPGYTPVKGVDYFDGEPGEPGYTPVKGKDYFDGEPGHTPVKGVDYFDGEPGHTPVKGTDYYTEEEKAELTEEILTATKDEWIDLADITLEEAVSQVAFDKDVNGQPFSVRKLVAKVVLPEAFIYGTGVFVSTNVKLWGGVFAQHSMQKTEIRTITIELEVTDKFTEMKFNYNAGNQTAWSNVWDQSPRFIFPDRTTPITAFYYGLQNTTNLCLPVGTTIKVWGLKA